MSATAYTRSYGFGNYQITYPTRPLPGNEVDIELDAAAASTASLVLNLNKIQRSDGALANSIVTPESLGQGVLAMFASVGITPRGNWLTGTAYVVKDIVTQAGAVYVCALAHTAGTFATDLAAGKWALLSAAPANQTLNSTDAVTFASITATGDASFGGNATVTGWGKVSSYLLVGTTSRIGTEKLRVNGNVYVDNGLTFAGAARIYAVKKTNQTSGANCDLFNIRNDSLVPGCVVLKLKVWVFNTDVQNNYVTGYWEVPVFVVNTGGSDNSAVGTTIFNQVRSVNSSIIDLSTNLGLACAVSGDSVTIYCVPTLSGSGAATKVTVYAEAEAIGDNAPLLLPSA